MKHYLLGGIVLTTALSLAPMAQAGANNLTGMSASATALDKTYTRIDTDLGNGSSTSTIGGLFINFSDECVWFATYGSRYGSQVQRDILNVARIGNGWAWSGYILISTNRGFNIFKKANIALSAALAKLDYDVKHAR